MAEPQAGAGQRVEVRWRLSAHARRLLTLGIGGLLVAVLTGRPEFAGLAAPAVLLLATWRRDHPQRVGLTVSVPDPQVTEGETVSLRAELTGQRDYDAEVRLRPAAMITAGPATTLPATADPATADPATADPATAAASTRPVRLTFRPDRWGRRPVGTVQVLLRDFAWLAEGTASRELPQVDCAPLPAGLSTTILLSKLPSRLGEHPARVAGDGGEFAGVREFVPGDRQRRINWAATTRRGALHLTMFAAERALNVVVIADVTTDVGEPGRTTLDLVLRGAAGVMARYLASRDRVGLVRFGTTLGWVSPGQGRRQQRRLLDLLVAGPPVGDQRGNLTRLPRAALPPGALIVAFSPLLDPLFTEAVRDLRERGFAVLVVDVLNAAPRHDASTLSNLTARIWQLEQQAIRFSLTEIGVPVTRWDGQSSLDEPFAPYARRPVAAGRR